MNKWIAVVFVWLLASTATQAGTRHYYYTDPQGTVLAKADATGNIIETTDYRPYGARALGTAANGPGYTGHVNDTDSGFVYMQARYYDPAIGIFLSVDPAGVTNSEDFCRYCYAGDNPISNVDLDGRQKTVVWLVELTASGMRKVAQLSREQAVLARRDGKNILTNRRQVSSGIERAAHPGGERLKHEGHDLEGGGKGLPHYQTEDVAGHSFWGTIAVAAAFVGDGLHQAAEAAEYIPDPVPRPATQEDTQRTNNVIDMINKAINTTIPHLPNVPEPTLPISEPKKRDASN